MEMFPLLDSPFVTWVVIPLLIILARIIDVTLGTMRIIYISRGVKFLAPLFGFFEILVWLVAIGQIMRNLNNPVYYIAYAVGFAAGNLLGIFVEERLVVGRVILRIITQKDATELAKHLRASGYGVTAVDAEGAKGPVKLLFTVIDRDKTESVVESVQTYNPRAFYSIEDVRRVKEGIFPPSRRFSDLIRMRRKG
ncbi:MAG: DUF2179 domain-containing protein [Deltaproteobacteria bacterium]|nr:DUF2179 domain-containing protein [Deltaproteobacteria bacterium]